MNEHCREIREKLEDRVTGEPSADARDAVDRHVADCGECKRYREALESDDRLFGAIAASMEGLGSRIEDGVMKARSERARPNRRDQRAHRFLERPAVRFAAAALVIVAIILASDVFDRSTTREVVWAEVAEKIENPPSYIARSYLTRDGQESPGFVRYCSPDLGRRIERYKDGSLYLRTIYITESRTHVFADFKTRVCLRDTIGPFPSFNPRKDAHLRRMREFMQRDHVDLGLSEIDGTTVSGIEYTDTLHSPWPEGKVRTKRIFADVETQLPVLFENGKGTDDYRRVEYEWQPDLTSGDFDPEIPDDFFVADLRDPIEDIVERATNGLHNFAQITGRYPEELNFRTLRQEVATELERLKQEGAYSPAVEDSLNTILYAGALSRWNDHAPRDFEPRIYRVYDSSVTPGDSEKILLRWRMRDKVGVIYGDLRFEVTGTEPFEEVDAKRWEDYQRRNKELQKKMNEDS